MLRYVAYDRDAAISYAERWALSRNPEYFDFQGLGGDCTNFVSQCVYAGCGVMNYTPDYGWYYINPQNRAPAWTGVEYFYRFFIENQSVGPHARRIMPDAAEPGDVIQLGDASGDFYHTLIVAGKQNEEIYVAAHTNDARYRPLSSYSFSQIRCLSVIGAYRWE